MQPHADRALQPNSGGFVQNVSRTASVIAPAVRVWTGAVSRPPHAQSVSHKISRRKGTITTGPSITAGISANPTGASSRAVTPVQNASTNGRPGRLEKIEAGKRLYHPSA